MCPFADCDDEKAEMIDLDANAVRIVCKGISG